MPCRCALPLSEIHHAVLSLDDEQRIDNDMVELMLKYVPTGEAGLNG